MKRNDDIDILKALGILVVVTCHVGINSFWASFFNLFHMCIFIFAAGFCFKSRSVETTVGQYVIKKTKALIVPYWLFNAALIILNNVFIGLRIYTNDPRFLSENLGLSNYYGLKELASFKETIDSLVDLFFFVGGTPQLGGVSWFLITLYIISILFFIVEKVLTHVCKCQSNIVCDYIRAGVAVILLLLGWIMPQKGYENRYTILTCFSVYFSYLLGFWAAKINKRINRKAFFLMMLLSLVVLLLITPYCSFGIAVNSYSNPLMLIIGTICGCAMMYSLSDLLSSVPYLNKLLTYAGKNSIYIMLFHFLSFKLVTLVYILWKGLNIYCLAAFPVLVLSTVWNVFYVIVGFFVPLLIPLTIMVFTKKVD